MLAAAQALDQTPQLLCTLAMAVLVVVATALLAPAILVQQILEVAVVVAITMAEPVAPAAQELL
jgi:hypothetical protein